MTTLSIRPIAEPANVWPDEGAGVEAWHRTLHKLRTWYADPQSVADDDIRPPSRTIIRLAALLCQLLQSKHWAEPTRTMASGEAGIVLEWVRGPSVTTCEVGPDQQVEISRHFKGQRQDRSRINLSQAEWSS